MTRISETFDRLRAGGRTGLVTYVTAGDPDLVRSATILGALDRAGADVLEVGVPFSDPLADGPVIQRAAERGLAAGTTLRATLGLVSRVRSTIAAPIVLFTYVNPLLRLGLPEFSRQASAAGVDGVLVLDLPIEEAEPLRQSLAAQNIDMIFLLSPTTTDERIRAAAALGRGFLYGISRLGVTGARAELAASARELADRVRSITKLPLAMGFGVSHPDHVAEIGRWADAAVVGSALVQMIAESPEAADLGDRITSYVRWLKNGEREGHTKA
jgi:tryptophan synthase alpha chain